jgi:hypothetical protein
MKRLTIFLVGVAAVVFVALAQESPKPGPAPNEPAKAVSPAPLRSSGTLTPQADAVAPKLSDSEIQSLNRIGEIAELQSKLADAQKRVIQLEQENLIMHACWARNVAEKDCSLQKDGTLKVPAAPAAAK